MSKFCMPWQPHQHRHHCMPVLPHDSCASFPWPLFFLPSL
jgi:hypothetical protein